LSSTISTFNVSRPVPGISCDRQPRENFYRTLRKAGYQSLYEFGRGKISRREIKLAAILHQPVPRAAVPAPAGRVWGGGRDLRFRWARAPGAPDLRASWRLPGGAIGHGEVPEAALRRELHEELGLSGDRVRLFGIYSRKLWWLTHVVALYVIEGGEIDFHPNLEVSAIRWDAADAPAPGAASATARRLAELAAGAQQDDRW
jgi:8-oxo-dGTP pyrophosphatase MutT (NUDIX family)